MLTSRLGTLGIEQFVGGNGDDVDNGDHNVDDDDGNNDDNDDNGGVVSFTFLL